MAHFRGTVQGNRNSTSRLGSKKSGLTTTANGWKVGIKVEAHQSHNSTGHEEDIFHGYLTSGSDTGVDPGCEREKLIGSFSSKDLSKDIRIFNHWPGNDDYEDI